jgi:ribosomal protein S18 acetylase RimI-like enzyme
LSLVVARVELPLSAGLQAAIDRFDCVGERYADDPVAQRVNDFLHDDGFAHGAEHGYSTTYALLDDEQDEPRDLVGYTTVCVDSIRLTNSERNALGQPDFPDFGAIKIGMIGVDHQHTGNGHGELLLRTMADLARSVGEFIAVRFLTADANVTQQGWYEALGWVVNRSKDENPDKDEPLTVSMRLDLRSAE